MPSTNHPRLLRFPFLCAAVLALPLGCAEPGDDAEMLGDETSGGTLDGSTTGMSTEDEGTGSEDTGSDASGTDESGAGDTTGTDGSGGDDGETTGSGTGGDMGCDTPDPGWVSPVVGAEPKHFDAINHDNTPFNLCDFKGERIVLDVSATWCGPCIMWAEVTSGAVDLTDPALGVDPESLEFFLTLQAAIDDGSIRWMTYLADPGTVEAAASWAQAYEHSEIPVFVAAPGEAAQLDGLFVSGAWPNFYLINEDFKWESTSAWPTDLSELGWI